MLAETRHLLEGEGYDPAVVGTRAPVARQMIAAAELLAALAAFVEHGYFDETVRDLREAAEPIERSPEERALLGDRNATPHLIAALDVRRAAVESLGSLRDPAAVEHRGMKIRR